VEATSQVPFELAESHQQRWSLFEAVVSLLRAAAETAPIVIVLDDLHDADAASVQLLGFVASQLRTQRVLIVAAARREDLAEAQAEVLSDLASSTTHVELRGLDAPALAQLVEEAAGIAVSGAVARRLHDHTGGNPFFTREVLRLLVAEGRLDQVETLPLPATVQTVVQRRLRGLSAACHRVLTVLAVAGEDSSVELIAAVSGLDPQGVMRAIDEATAARLVVSDRPGCCSFAHAVVRGTVYEGLDGPTRRHMHQRIGETLEQSAAKGALPVAQLAFHFLAALPETNPAKAARYAVDAGRQASELLAHAAAAHHYRDALAALDLDAGSSAACGRCSVTLGGPMAA
jgi:predicted ATPase